MANGFGAQTKEFGSLIKGLVQAAQQQGQDALDKNKPIFNINQLLQDAAQGIADQSVSTDRSNLQQASQGTEQRRQSFGLDENDPKQKATLDAVVGFEKKNTTEALEQGASAASVLNIARQRASDFTQETEALVNTEDQANKKKKEGIGFQQMLINSLLDATQEGGAQGFKTRDLANQRAQQEVSGTIPAQAGELKKIGINRKNAIELARIKAQLKAGGVDALKPEAASKFGLLVNGQNSLKQASAILENNPSVLFTGNFPSFLKSQEGRQFNTSIGNAFESRLRTVSGAAITEDEVARLKKEFLPKKTDSSETIRVKLSTLNDFFEGTLNVADPSGTHRQRFGGSQSQGVPTVTPEQRAQFNQLRNQGRSIDEARREAGF